MTSLPLHSPAELLLLLHNRHSPNLRQLLRVTFLDLLRQQVLAISQEETQFHPRDPVTWEQYVISGPALHTHAVLPHERLLLSTFQADDQLRIPFRQYVRMIFEKADKASAYYRLLEANTRTGQLFSQHWFLQLIGFRRLTPTGEQLRQLTENELTRLDKTFVAQAAHRPNEAHLFTQQVGGAIFLLPSVNSEMGRQLEQEFRRIPEPAYTFDTIASVDGGASWHTHGDTFDSHCPSGDAHSSGCGTDGSDSGCGGDSGCSGCGGCGGD